VAGSSSAIEDREFLNNLRLSVCDEELCPTDIIIIIRIIIIIIIIIIIKMKFVSSD
jgi:hypothetical protein